MASRFIGLDLGTTTFKGAVLNLDNGSIASVVRFPTPPPIGGLPSGRHELDPGAVLSTVRQLLEVLVDQAPDATGLVMCGQMHGLAFVDERGTPRSNIITWKDQRALERSASGVGSIIERVRAVLGPDRLGEIGGELRVGVPTTSLVALQEIGSLPAGLYATSLPDFVLANLCGRPPTTDATNAAAHGLFQLDERAWHRQLIAQLELDQLHWPAIQFCHDVVGEVVVGGRALTCFTPVGDQQCALIGAGLSERELSLNISTGSQVSRIGCQRPRGAFLVRPYFDGLWLSTIVSVPAGRALQVLVDLLSELGGSAGDPWERIRAAVDVASVSDLEVELSFFPSFTGDRGRIGNIHEGNLSVGSLFMAAFRSMAANYARCAAILSPEHDWDRVVFSGGLAQRFERLRGECLAALGDPQSRLCPTEEETLDGLLALALVCDGRAPTVAEANRMIRRG